jgi:trimeric autotransporter adhesin
MTESKARLISKAFTATGDVKAENLDAGIDSADVVTLIDSAYVSARAPGASGLDSAASLALITGGNAITITSGVVNHNDTSSQASVNNTGSNFIQDITLDDYGHVTAITSAEATGGGGGSVFDFDRTFDYNIISTNSAFVPNANMDANIMIGVNTGGTSNSQAAYNAVVGGYSAQALTTGYRNYIFGGTSYNSLSSGYDNIGLGFQTGGTLSTGFANTYIGYQAVASSSFVNTETVIGYQLTGKGSLTTLIRGTAYNSSNTSTWATSSDERIKTNITDFTLGLDTLGQVNVKTYNYLSDSDIATAHPELADSNGLVHEGLDTEKTIVGIMAQELEAILPNSVETRDNGIKSVNKDELFWVMLNSIKELKIANDSLVARVEALENA